MRGTRELCRKKRFLLWELRCLHGTTVLCETTVVSFSICLNLRCVYFYYLGLPLFYFLLLDAFVAIICPRELATGEYKSVPLRQVYLASPRLLITIAYDDVKVTVTQSDVTSLFISNWCCAGFCFTLVRCFAKKGLSPYFSHLTSKHWTSNTYLKNTKNDFKKWKCLLY